MENERLKRTEILIGTEALNKIKQSKILIVGIGGVGGYVAEALARTGIGKIDLIDNDVVSESNINRQIIALTDTIGKLKVECMKERINQINPSCDVKAINQFLTKENINELDLNYDYVVDAIDTVSAKLALIERCTKEDIKIISAMGTGNKLNPAKLTITDLSKTTICPLPRVVRYELRKKGINHLKVCYSTEEPAKVIVSDENSSRHAPGSISFVPSAAGLLIASEIVREIIK